VKVEKSAGTFCQATFGKAEKPTEPIEDSNYSPFPSSLLFSNPRPVIDFFLSFFLSLFKFFSCFLSFLFLLLTMASPAPAVVKPTKPDEEAYKINLAQAEKEHTAAQEKLVWFFFFF